MSEAVEWEWRREDPAEYAWDEALDVYGAYALGELVRVVIKQKADPDAVEPDDVIAERLGVANPFVEHSAVDGTVWNHHVVYSRHREGMDGFEFIETFTTLTEGQVAIDGDREALVAMIRDDQ
jgi:hypothetical protein